MIQEHEKLSEMLLRIIYSLVHKRHRSNFRLTDFIKAFVSCTCLG